MPSKIPTELFNKATQAVFTKTALSLEHCDEIVRIVIDAVDLEMILQEPEQLRDFEASERQKWQDEVARQDKKITELENALHKPSVLTCHSSPESQWVRISFQKLEDAQGLHRILVQWRDEQNAPAGAGGGE